ncbi:MAG: hypothetical protein MIO92_13260 [Methanosarcinaceae archaeon]|jgi:outer membrane protein assembly factor BamE (lipoprotein component of BamABCDE complex)|nr:hypothetical protein [Methanosarcinaceae archaeon]
MVKRLSPQFAITVVCLTLLFAGCTTIKIGSVPDTMALTQLSQNVSTKADVLRVLGPPRGYGMVRLFNESEPARLFNESEPRVLWFYEYLEADVQNAHMKMLLVIFDGEKFSGHFWFSSFEKVKVIQ